MFEAGACFSTDAGSEGASNSSENAHTEDRGEDPELWRPAQLEPSLREGAAQVVDIEDAKACPESRMLTSGETFGSVDLQ